MVAAAPLAGLPMPAFAGETEGSTDGFVPIGGIEQWLSIRPAGPADPVLLFLHGGPGEAMSPFASLFDPWRHAFTVALWDQRGAGRTFGRDRAGQGEMSLTRLTADTIAIAEHLCARLGKTKIVLAGQSWGSILAWNTIHARPDLFSAYVGTGQSVNWGRSIISQERYARARATAADDREALAALDAAQRLPISDMARTAPLRRWIMPPADLAFLEEQRRFVGARPHPETGPVGDWVAGFGFSAEALTPAVVAFDAYASGPSAAIPVVVIQGRDDHITPTDVAERFVSDLAAPAKAFATIEGGHFACYTNAQAFVGALTAHVRPLTG
ncbi:alpha/beta hydrolase [Sphingosinicella sp. LHD-64]|uniref:alpha/beta fold hydrolase n=1 Tax=Sphingosinicella sp. LHD-64 TaxID=3072139 RepID=UPI00280EC076|nr:alpha/beta hydrolase [Sphingosinicella sp. LHD-64]MDQ8758166.1 alpha/beta hydrolase [Sphingosinicella sp. LHD-64]